MDSHTAELKLAQKKFRNSAQLALWLVVILWLVKIAEMLSGVSLVEWGIYPRSWKGLPGILLSPFIHSDYMHLFSNSVPLFVLLTGFVYYYRRMTFWVVLFVYLLGGIGVWLIARPSWHIGASGIVYGLIGFIFFSGLFRKEPPAMALSLIVIFLYGGFVWGLLPNEPGISWEAHLVGALSGIAAALVCRFVYPPPDIIDTADWEERYAAGYNEDGEFSFEEED